MNLLNKDDLAAAYRLLNPPLILLSSALYGIGPAIAQYLGRRTADGRLWLGLLVILLIQVSAQLLLAFFEQEGNRLRPERKLPIPGQTGLSNISLRAVFYSAAGCLALAGSLVAILVIDRSINILAGCLLIGGTMLALAYGVPPLKLQSSGFGEISLAFLLAAGLPAFSFALATSEFHRLIFMSTAPIVGVLFAVQISLALTRYGEHDQAQHKNILVRLGWRQAMRLHDVSLILSFIALGLAFAFGLPRRIALGSFIVIPLAIIEIWYFSRIRAGAPVRWRLVGFNSRAMLALMVYFALTGYLLS